MSDAPALLGARSRGHRAPLELLSVAEREVLRRYVDDGVETGIEARMLRRALGVGLVTSTDARRVEALIFTQTGARIAALPEQTRARAWRAHDNGCRMARIAAILGISEHEARVYLQGKTK